jgi:hypothetical protein
MDSLQFFSSLASTLAWPAVTLFVLFKFKGEIAKLIPALQRLKVGAFEADFAKDLSKVATVVEQATPSLPDASATIGVEVNGDMTGASSTSNTTNLLEFMEPEADRTALKVNPTGVVMESWKDLDATIRTIASRVSPSMDRPSRQLGAILHMLEDGNVLNSDEVKSIFDLQRLRNKAAHSNESISADSAKQFTEVSETLIWRFRERAAKLGLWK